MLEIKIFNKFQSSDININVISFVFVLRGKAVLDFENNKKFLETGEFFIINVREKFEIDSTDSGLICGLYIDYGKLCSILGYSSLVFENNVNTWTDAEQKVLENILNELINIFVRRNKEERLLLESIKWQFIYILVKNALQKVPLENKPELEAAKIKMLQFVWENYSRRLTVRQAAEYMVMSVPSFFRFCKKILNMPFMEYVSQIRMEMALRALESTGKSVTDVAMDCGYTDVAAFSRKFKERYGYSPREYRKRTTEKYHSEWHVSLKTNMDNTPENREDGKKDVSEEQIEINMMNWKAYEKIWNQGINIGMAQYILMKNVQEHILILCKELGVKYIRIWNIFSSKVLLRKDHAMAQLNFSYVDEILDFIVNNHIDPILDLGNRPENTIRSEQELYLPTNLGEAHLIFKNFQEWRFIVSTFVEHVVGRYGKETVSSWIFELWQDVTGKDFYGDSGYFDVFEIYIEIIKKKIPQARVGGGGWASEEQFLQACQNIRKMKYRPDFISVYFYMLHQNALESPMHSYKKGFFSNALKKRHDILKQYGLEQIKLYMTEWNLSIENRNYFNDSCGKAAMMVGMMIDCIEAVDMGCYFTGSDRTLLDYDSVNIMEGALGLLSKDGLRKPSFWAMKFMGMLDSNIVSRGKYYLMTSDGKGKYSIILTNYKNFSLDYCIGIKDNLSVKRADLIYDNDETIHFELDLFFWPDQQYMVRQYKFGPNTDHYLNTYKVLKNGIDFTEDKEFLDCILTPEGAIEIQVCKNKKLRLSFMLETHTFSLVQIFPVSTK